MTANNSEKKNHTEKINSAKILNACTFMLGTVSWVCTSYGLKNFLHLPDWQAFMISFVVQSLLVYMNINLPKLFKRDQEQLHSQSGTSNKGIRKTLRMHWRKIASVSFYIILVGISSTFAFVFMVNYAYSMTWHNDANSIVSSRYRSILHSADGYIGQRLTVNERNISIVLAQLQAEIPRLPRGDSFTMLNYKQLEANLYNLESRLTEIKERKASIDRNLKDATDSKNLAQETYTAAINPTLWTRSSTRDANVAQAKELLDSYQKAEASLRSEQSQVDDEIKQLNEEIRTTKTQMEDSQIAFDNEIYLILKELVKTQPDLGRFDNAAENILEIISGSKGTTYESESFTVLVDKLQTLRRLLAEHSSLQQSQISIKNMIEKQEAPAPIPNSTEKEAEIGAWQTYWYEQIDSLNTKLQTLPVYIKCNDDDQVSLQVSKVDTSIWNKKLDLLRRNMVGNVNPLERAFQLLVGEYNVLAIITYILAILIDTMSFFAGLFNIIYKMLSRKASSRASLSLSPSPS